MFDMMLVVASNSLGQTTIPQDQTALRKELDRLRAERLDARKKAAAEVEGKRLV
jgi:hypothetical protein